MKAYFGRRYMLSASHRLTRGALDAPSKTARRTESATTRTAMGITILSKFWWAARSTAETGMVVDLVALDEAVRTRVMDRFDHANLNLDPLFADRVPTTENFCRTIFGLLKDALPAGELGTCPRGRNGK